jgi:L-lactate permease
MNFRRFLLSWTPILLLVGLKVWIKRPALDLALAGSIFSSFLVWLGFQTSGKVIFLSALDGFLTVGAGIGSLSSPFKIAIATPMCGAQGLEGEILRKTVPLRKRVSLLTGLTLFLF